GEVAPRRSARSACKRLAFEDDRCANRHGFGTSAEGGVRAEVRRYAVDLSADALRKRLRRARCSPNTRTRYTTGPLTPTSNRFPRHEQKKPMSATDAAAYLMPYISTSNSTRSMLSTFHRLRTPAPTRPFPIPDDLGLRPPPLSPHLLPS